jgi:hypothetical protein
LTTDAKGNGILFGVTQFSAAPSAPPTRRTGCFSNTAIRGSAL